MNKEDITKKIKFAEQCATAVEDINLKSIAFEVVLQSLIRIYEPVSCHPNLDSCHNTDTKESGNNLSLHELWDKLTTFFETPQDKLTTLVKLSQDGDYELNSSNFTDSSDQSEREFNTSVVLIALNSILKNDNTMSSGTLADKLTKLGVKTGETVRYIERRTKTPEGVILLAKGVRRGKQYTITSVGKNLAKKLVIEFINKTTSSSPKDTKNATFEK